MGKSLAGSKSHQNLKERLPANPKPIVAISFRSNSRYRRLPRYRRTFPGHLRGGNRTCLRPSRFSQGGWRSLHRECLSEAPRKTRNRLSKVKPTNIPRCIRVLRRLPVMKVSLSWRNGLKLWRRQRNLTPDDSTRDWTDSAVEFPPHLVGSDGYPRCTARFRSGGNWRQMRKVYR